MSRKCVVQFFILLFSFTSVQCEEKILNREGNIFRHIRRRREIISTECGGHYAIHHGDVKIKSPVEGKAYAPELECLWTLVGGDSCLPEIICKDVDLRPIDCEEEHLIISDGAGGELKLCGSVKDTSPPRRSSSRGRDLFIQFKSSANTTFDRAYKGFTCSIYCAKNLKKVTSQKLPPDDVVLKENSACVCGVKHNLDRIVGGETANEFEFPWQAAIVKPRTRSPVCGGSVINNKWILTAAHCFYFTHSQPADFEIVLHAHTLDFNLLKGYDRKAELGELGSVKGTGWNASRRSDKDEKSLRFEIDEIILHPMMTKLYDYDVALIKVVGKIPLGGENQPLPICLPPLGAYRISFAKVHALVSGWGLPHEDAGSTTRTLQKLHVPILKTTQCQKMLSEHTISKRMMCAGFKAGLRDACKGDSGGPIVAKLTKYQYTQIGVVSWGKGCARANKPGVYSRMTELIQWVLFHTRHSDATWCKSSLQ